MDQNEKENDQDNDSETDTEIEIDVSGWLTACGPRSCTMEIGLAYAA